MNPDNIYTAYFNVGQHYTALVQPYALNLLGILILLEIATISLTYMMGDSDNPPAVLWSIVRLLFTGGFAYWWIIQSWTLGLYVVGSFNQLGQNLTGLSNLTPMQFLNTGLSMAKVIFSAPASDRLIPQVGAAMEQIALCFAILLIFLIVATLVVVTLTAFYLIVGPGSILIAFMPCRFTSVMAENYFTWLVRVGVIVMLFYVVLGTAEAFAIQYNTTLTSICHPVLAVTPLAVLGAVPVDVSSTMCSNPIPTTALLQVLADMMILAGICAGIPFAAGALVNHGVNMTLEHLASAKYLAGGIARPVTAATRALGHQISRAYNNNQTQTTLQQRMAAGADAASRVASSQPPPPNAYGVQPTQTLNGGAKPTSKI
jgi:P-type conjugative transfer protein TrbL